MSLSNTASTSLVVDVEGSTNLKLHITSNLAVKSPIKVVVVNANRGLIHVSQNIPTKSALDVKMVKPKDVTIQVSGCWYTRSHLPPRLRRWGPRRAAWPSTWWATRRQTPWTSASRGPTGGAEDDSHAGQHILQNCVCSFLHLNL